MGIKRTWRKIKSAAKRLFRPPVGFPLGVHVRTEAADHAEDFARRYAEPLDWQVAIRMEELGIPNDRIGSSDRGHGLSGRAFNPYERDGGGNTPDGRLNLDSGILNPELFRQLGPEASTAYAKARLRDRMDAGIAHEYEEVKGGGDHVYAYEHAPDTELPIRREARDLARKIREGERRAARRRG
jgi:hypothetical protein